MSDFVLITTELPVPEPGQMLLRTHSLGFSPAQEGWMENVADYAAPMEIGDVMRGFAVSEVVASHEGCYPVSTLVGGSTCWTEYHLSDGTGLTDAEPGPPSSAMLSVLGISGLAACRDRMAYREDIQHGFETAPSALNRLFTGANRGEKLLKLD